MTRCCHRCKSVPGVCALSQTCRCHNETIQDRADQFARDLQRATTRHQPIAEHTQRAILAARLGIDGPVEVARAHQVPVGAVIDMWRDSRKGE